MDLERIGPPWKPGEVVTMAACHDPACAWRVVRPGGLVYWGKEEIHRDGSKLATATSRGHTLGWLGHSHDTSGTIPVEKFAFRLTQNRENGVVPHSG